jgi:ATP-dependent protease HslVU (ClpYQ) peptidase subunit
MTTIVATPTFIAADRAVTTDNGVTSMVKVQRIRGSLWGFCGSPTDALRFLRWVRGGCRASTKPDWAKKTDFEVLQVNASGDIFAWDMDLEPIHYPGSQYHAIGSGGDFALGALDRAGAAHVDEVVAALRVAAHRDVNTRAPYDILFLDKKIPHATFDL